MATSSPIKVAAHTWMRNGGKGKLRQKEGKWTEAIGKEEEDRDGDSNKIDDE